jgi:hypothetical protein
MACCQKHDMLGKAAHDILAMLVSYATSRHLRSLCLATTLLGSNDITAQNKDSDIVTGRVVEEFHNE